MAKIHIAKSQLGLEDETYRAMLRLHGGAESCRDIDEAGLLRVLKHLRAAGFRDIGRGGAALRPKQRAVWALWLTLADRGIVHRSQEALDSFVKRQVGVDSVRWLPDPKAAAVIEALKQWVARTAATITEEDAPF